MALGKVCMSGVCHDVNHQFVGFTLLNKDLAGN